MGSIPIVHTFMLNSHYVFIRAWVTSVRKMSPRSAPSPNVDLRDIRSDGVFHRSHVRITQCCMPFTGSNPHHVLEDRKGTR